MPFENLETITKHNMPPMAKISYMPPQSRGKSAGKPARDPKPQLIVSIPSTICGTAKAKTFDLLLGSGADAGKLRIKGSKAAKGIEPKELMHAFIFRFGYVPGDKCEPPKALAHDAVQKWIGGWHEGQTILASAFKKKRPVDAPDVDPAQIDLKDRPDLPAAGTA